MAPGVNLELVAAIRRVNAEYRRLPEPRTLAGEVVDRSSKPISTASPPAVIAATPSPRSGDGRPMRWPPSE